MGHRLVCLLPARNAAPDLPGFFASVAGLCDAVVALDDGSTDDTRAVLEASPLVEVLLTNPVRPDYRGWDDAANRNRLLKAAAALEPEWLLSLDADERIDASDAAPLRAFLELDALPGCAYGFRHVPMREDGEHFLPRYQWVYRLFPYAPGLRFPNDRLHFTPIPTAIPRERWLKTTLRIQHLGGMTPQRRLVRYAKYLEADPFLAYQSDYGHIVDDPDAGSLRRWQPRPPGLEVLLPPQGDEETGPAGAPVISAVVISRDDEATIERTVASVVGQVCDEPFEVIVVVSGTDRTAEIVRERFPGVRLIVLDRPALPGEARNAGLRAASGNYVTFPGSHIELPPGSLAARVAAHRRGYALVTGVTRNGNTTKAGWASYFLDHHNNLPGHEEAEFEGPPAYCSYARVPLLDAGAFPEGVRTGEDTAAIRAMVRAGYAALRDPAVEMTHRSPCSTRRKLVRHHFVRGRGWGRLLQEGRRGPGPLLDRRFLSEHLIHSVPQRLEEIRVGVGLADAELLEPYLSVRRLVAVGAVAGWAGMWWELLRPGPGKLDTLIGRRVRVLAVATGGASPRLSVVRLDLASGQAQVFGLAPDLELADEDDVLTRIDDSVRQALRDRTGEDLDRLRRITATVSRLDVDGVLAGDPEAVGRILGRMAGPDDGAGGSGPSQEGGAAASGAAASGAAASWTVVAAPGRRGLATTLGRRELLAVAGAARRSRAVERTAVAAAGEATLTVPPARTLRRRRWGRQEQAVEVQDELATPRGRDWMA